MNSGRARKMGLLWTLVIGLLMAVSTPQEAAALSGREDSCGPGEQKDRVSGPATVGQLKLTDRGTTGASGFSYLDVEFISKSASCNGSKLLITNEAPFYALKYADISQIKEKCVDPSDICLEGAIFYYNYTDGDISNPAPPDCAPRDWDQVVVNVVLTMDKSLAPPNPFLIADVVLLWFNPLCQE